MRIRTTFGRFSGARRRPAPLGSVAPSAASWASPEAGVGGRADPAHAQRRERDDGERGQHDGDHPGPRHPAEATGARCPSRISRPISRAARRPRPRSPSSGSPRPRRGRSSAPRHPTRSSAHLRPRRPQPDLVTDHLRAGQRGHQPQRPTQDRGGHVRRGCPAPLTLARRCRRPRCRASAARRTSAPRRRRSEPPALQPDLLDQHHLPLHGCSVGSAARNLAPMPEQSTTASGPPSPGAAARAG